MDPNWKKLGLKDLNAGLRYVVSHMIKEGKHLAESGNGSFILYTGRMQKIIDIKIEEVKKRKRGDKK